MTRYSIAAAAGLLVAAAGWVALKAQDPVPEPVSVSSSDGSSEAIDVTPAVTEVSDDTGIADSSCTFFGPQRDKFLAAQRDTYAASHLTEDVVAKLGTSKKLNASAVAGLPSAPGGSRTDSQQNTPVSLIDTHIFQKMAEQKVAPAPMSTDYEFLRRVTLDLTGRIPTPTEITTFVNSAAPDKRAKLVDQLLATPQWVDKWTIFLGDLYENNSTNILGENSRRYIQGVVAFNNFIRTSLQTEKPYNQMVQEMISATGTDSYSQGDLNFLIGGVMGGGPIQDVFDQQTAIIAEKFLGLAHVNCLLCHNGRGHLDSLSLWGYSKSRSDAWGMSSFLSHTATVRIPWPTNTNQGYWALVNDIPVGTVVGTVTNRTNYTVDYQLNTTTGNRPARTSTAKSVKPMYLNGASPSGNTNYRTFLAQQVTGDFQFARATVNYLWEYFYGIGLVTPSNQFDPLRLDPDNPPSDCPLDVSPCTLQASHPRLLNELAQRFINSNYNLKALMRDMVNSRTYQLSSRYEGEWNSANERLFARKLVRRLWSEEVHDAIAQSSGIGVSYTNPNWNPSTVTTAMQLPEPLNTPNTAVSNFMNPFLRGNRDDETRRGDSTSAQALTLMNDTFVMSRVTSNSSTGLLIRALAMTNTDLVQQMYLNVLSRYPTPEEQAAAVANMNAAGVSGTGAARKAEAQALLWSLYNKVDFIFNY